MNYRNGSSRISTMACATTAILALSTPCWARDKFEGIEMEWTEPAPWELSTQSRNDYQDKNYFHGCVIEAAEVERAKQAVRRAENLGSTGHFDEALTELNTAIDLANSAYRLTNWRILRAKVYVKLGNKSAALADAKAAVSNPKLDIGPLLEVVKVLLAIGENQLAEETVGKFLPRFSASPPRISAELLFLRGCALQRGGRFQEAKSNFLQAANSFMISGKTDPAQICLSRIDVIDHKAVGTKVSILIPPKKNLEKLKSMVSMLVNAKGKCFSPEFVESATGAKLSGTSGDFHEQMIPNQNVSNSLATTSLTPPERLATKVADSHYGHFEGIDSVRLNTSKVPSKLDITLRTEVCCLEMKDIADILKGLKKSNERSGWNEQLNGRHNYEMPDGTVSFVVSQSGFPAIRTIRIVSSAESPALDFPSASFLLVRVIDHCLGDGRKEAALDMARAWLQREPDSELAWITFARTLAENGKFQDAIDELDKLIRARKPAVQVPKWQARYNAKHVGDPALALKGAYLSELGRNEDAMRCFASGFPSILLGDHYLWRGKAELGQKQFAEASRDLKAAVDCFYKEARIVRRDEARKLLEWALAKEVPAKAK